jgi:hypothetical protein
MHLDVKTLFVVLALITTVVGLALLFYGKKSKTYPGYVLWMMGTLAAAVGYSTTVLRGTIPVWSSVLVVNGAFVLAGLFRLDGIMQFLQAKSLRKIYYSLPVISISLASYYYFAVDSMIIRAWFLTLWICLLSWAIAAVLIRNASQGTKTLNLVAAGINTMYGVAMLLRTIFWARNASTGLFDNSSFHSLFFISVIAYEIWLGLLIMMMNSQRQEEEIKHQQEELVRYVAQLEKTMSEVKVLKGLLPICATCKKIRDDKGYWNQLESYIDKHSEARFTHGICPDCATVMRQEIERMQSQNNSGGKAPHIST